MRVHTSRGRNIRTSMSYPALTKEIASEIFESSAPYRDDDEKEACQVRTYRRLHLYTLLIDGLIAIM